MGSIEVDRRHRRAKTDKLDVRNLLEMLVRSERGEQGVWRVVNVPSVEEQEVLARGPEEDALVQRILTLALLRGMGTGSACPLADGGAGMELVALSARQSA